MKYSVQTRFVFILSYYSAVNCFRGYHVSKLQFSSAYALNALWGRFDHTLGNISTLYSFATSHNIPIYLLSEDSLVFLLQPVLFMFSKDCSFLTAVASKGRHIIKVDTGFEEGHCGLVPVGLTCKSCSTTGLEWNLGMFT